MLIFYINPKYTRNFEVTGNVVRALNKKLLFSRKFSQWEKLVPWWHFITLRIFLLTVKPHQLIRHVNLKTQNFAALHLTFLCSDNCCHSSFSIKKI